MHQEFGEIISSLDISIIEITIIFFISLIGSITHEYISIIKNINKLNKLEILISIISSTIIITIVCISINPLIVKISPRLILLPPLILSLTGSELIIYLTGFKSSAKLIEYILSFFGINRSKDNIQDVTEIDGVLNPDQKIIQKEKELVNGLKAMLGIYAKVKLVAPKSIVRSEGKAVRVIDRRNLYQG